MRLGMNPSPELVADIKSRVAEGIIAAARENPGVLELVQRLVAGSFHGAEQELALAWLRDQTECRENAKLLIRFPGNPPPEVDRELAALGFEWSNFSKGWMGEGNLQLIQEKFSRHGAAVVRC